jgi:MarR family transcriptional regulator, organic hydroperoxide resistance regulator
MESNAAVVAEIVDNIRRIFQSINEHSKKVKRETGLTGPQLWAIKTMAESSPMSVSDLARRIYLHPATVVGILDRLEFNGLVRRVRSMEDRRVVKLQLTARGKALVKDAPEVVQGVLVSGLEHLSDRKLAAIGDGLSVLVDILGVKSLPPKLIGSREVNVPQKRIRHSMKNRSRIKLPARNKKKRA